MTDRPTPLPTPQLVRVAETARPRLPFVLDGAPVEALAGDTVLTAILTQQRRVRVSEFGDGPRAGFCLIGACQDCWVREESGARLRACSTPLRAGMRIVTTAVVSASADGEAEAGFTAQGSAA
ncbi:(2Fe-2S)-binding protein [Burkholderia sp. Ac-20379]|uniref:(2Fe-2S)-binding protein n=1 Tax=Burkholderia sp. Ac-20379 TaxID=2703900 RepID=UPI00197DD0ED|nr:(2Fe-2S)-binding protein [Burkholderia sp. Ac-20379]MBN3726766.1 (2Fe-2S)-binding protein [Burkholderia sp. Ac-20379]